MRHLFRMQIEAQMAGGAEVWLANECPWLGLAAGWPINLREVRHGWKLNGWTRNSHVGWLVNISVCEKHDYTYIPLSPRPLPGWRLFKTFTRLFVGSFSGCLNSENCSCWLQLESNKSLEPSTATLALPLQQTRVWPMRHGKEGIYPLRAINSGIWARIS